MPAISRAVALALIAGLAARAVAAAESWEATLDPGVPGKYRQPRSVQATYEFGWNGITAATAEVSFGKAANRYELRGNGHTVGLTRSIWKFDLDYRALANVETLRPIGMKQSESARNKNIVTELTFDSAGVARTRTETPAKGKSPKTRRFDFPNLFDLSSALLYLRSQPLQEKEVHRLVVYPATSAYLATVTVLGREEVAVAAGKFKAVKLDLQLSKVRKDRQLEPHQKFRRATVWILDDQDRMILRIEAQIFVGTVFAELQTVRYEGNNG